MYEDDKVNQGSQVGHEMKKKGKLVKQTEGKN